jgi:hypothetical protein
MNKTQIDKAAKGVLELINATESDFASWTKKNQRKILDAIIGEINGIPTDGGKVANDKKTRDFIASLPTRVRAALKKTGYLAKTDAYIRQFEKAAQMLNTLPMDNSIN